MLTIFQPKYHLKLNLPQNHRKSIQNIAKIANIVFKNIFTCYQLILFTYISLCFFKYILAVAFKVNVPSADLLQKDLFLIHMVTHCYVIIMIWNWDKSLILQSNLFSIGKSEWIQTAITLFNLNSFCEIRLHEANLWSLVLTESLCAKSVLRFFHLAFVERSAFAGISYSLIWLSGPRPDCLSWQII